MQIKIYISFLITALFLCVPHTRAQEIEVPITLNEHGTQLRDVLRKIEQQSPYLFLYNETQLDMKQKINEKITSPDIRKILDRLCGPIGIRYEIMDVQILLMPKIDSKYSINSLVYWVTYVHNVVYSFYRSMIYCYINSTQRCAGSIEIDIIPTNGADKRKFSPFAPYFPVTNVIKRYFYPYFPAIIGIKGYSFPYFPYLSGIMKIKTALYSLFSRLDWHKTVVFPCLGEIYEGIRSLSWEIPVT